MERRRAPRRLGHAGPLALATVVSAALLAGCSTSSTSGSTTTSSPAASTTTTSPTAGSATTAPPTSTTLPLDPAAVRLQAAAVANGNRATSLHYANILRSSTQRMSISGDVTQTTGSQVISGTISGVPISASERLIGHEAYVIGNAGALEEFFDFPASLATTYAEKWISVVPSDSSFASTAEWLTVDSVVKSMEVGAPVTAGRAISAHGSTVTPLDGGLIGPSVANEKGTATVTVSLTAHPLPVRWVAHFAEAKAGTESLALSKWGEQVTVTAPTTSIPLASIAGSGGGTGTTQPPIAL